MTSKTIVFGNELNFNDALAEFEADVKNEGHQVLYEAKLYYVNGRWSWSVLFGPPQQELDFD